MATVAQKTYLAKLNNVEGRRIAPKYKIVPSTIIANPSGSSFNTTDIYYAIGDSSSFNYTYYGKYYKWNGSAFTEQLLLPHYWRNNEPFWIENTSTSNQIIWFRMRNTKQHIFKLFTERTLTNCVATITAIKEYRSTTQFAYTLSAGSKVWICRSDASELICDPADTSDGIIISCYSGNVGMSIGGDLTSIIYRGWLSTDSFNYLTILPSATKSLDISQLFQGLTQLTNAVKLELPLNPTNMRLTFDGCTNLIIPPTEFPALIHTNADSYTNTFRQCTALIKSPIIYANQSVVSYEGIFDGCTNLSTIYLKDPNLQRFSNVNVMGLPNGIAGTLYTLRGSQPAVNFLNGKTYNSTLLTSSWTN